MEKKIQREDILRDIRKYNNLMLGLEDLDRVDLIFGDNSLSISFGDEFFGYVHGLVSTLKHDIRLKIENLETMLKHL